MTANPSIDPAGFLAEHLERAEPDLLRAMLKTFVEALMAAETVVHHVRGLNCHPPCMKAWGGCGRKFRS